MINLQASIFINFMPTQLKFNDLIDKEILDNWRMTKWINNTLKLKVKVLDDKIVNGESVTKANVLLAVIVI